MTQQLQKETLNIMDKCNEVLQKQNHLISNNSNFSKLNKINKNKQLLLEAMSTQFSPEQQSQNDKIIEKFRRKYNKKKEVKQVVIRKTDLGENELIFTKQEFQKLKEIDDEEMFGYSSAKIDQNSTMKDNSLKPQQQTKKYFFNPTFDKPKEEIQKYLDWVNLNQVKGSKDNNKNKVINFQKRLNASTPNLLAGNKKMKLPSLKSPKNQSSFKRSSNLSIQNLKPIPLITKNSVDKNFLNSINTTNEPISHKRLTKEEKMNEIVDKVGEKIEKTLSSSASEKVFIYMTEERKQALFQCQVLRRIKREIGPKYFNNLHITYGSKSKSQHKESEQSNENKDATQKQNLMRKTGINHNGKQRGFVCGKQRDGQFEAERMIQKNINRLKQERKRVIEKIVC